MKIAICTNAFHPLIGGCEAVTKKIAEHLSAKHKVFIFTRHVPNRNVNSRYRIVEYQRNDKQFFFDRLLEKKFDIVFIYSDMFDFFRFFLKERWDFKLIIALCGANYTYNNKIILGSFPAQVAAVSKIVCHSTVDRDYQLCQKKNLLSKTSVIPNGVDLSEFDNNQITRQKLSKKYNIDDSKKWILNVSNFFPGKKQEWILYLFRPLYKKIDNSVYIQIASDTPFPVSQQIESQWLKYKTQNNIQDVFLLKNIPRSDVVAFMKSSQVFAFPSAKEVAPIVILESMASRLPWAGFAVGNTIELKGGKCISCHKDRNDNCVIKERETLLLQQNIIDILNNPTEFQISGREQVESNFTWDKILPKYEEIMS